MRPEIPEGLEQRIEEVYQFAGFDTKGELVREATREYVNELEAELHAGDVDARELMDVSIGQTYRGPQIRLRPSSDSSLRFRYFSKGDPPHTTYLDTGTTIIGQDAIKETLQIEGVREDGVSILTKGEIKIDVRSDNSTALTGDDSLVNRIYNELETLIEDRNQRVVDGEETKADAERRALTGYWSYAHQIGK